MSPSIAKYLTIYTKHSNFVFNILLSSLRIILAFIFLSPIFKRLDFIIYSQLILFICRNYIKAISKMLDMHCIYKVKDVLDNYYTNHTNGPQRKFHILDQIFKLLYSKHLYFQIFKNLPFGCDTYWPDLDNAPLLSFSGTTSSLATLLEDSSFPLKDTSAMHVRGFDYTYY